MEAVLTKTGVRATIGETNIFFADNRLFRSTTLALARARSIVGVTGDRAPTRGDTVTAAHVMSPQCIRFGNKHQLREAVWLLSELHKHTKAISYQPLFLQDREGKLFGELSPWRVLGALVEGAVSCNPDADDAEVAKALRRDFTRPIRTIARTGLAWHAPGTPLTEVLQAAVRTGEHVTPICDAEGRVKGLLRADDLLRAVDDLLQDPAEGGRDDG